MKNRFVWACIATACFMIVTVELQTSYLQSQIFSRLSAELTYHIEPGKSGMIVFPKQGPHNHRQGFSQLPDVTARVQERGFDVVRQAQFSEPLLKYIEWGGYPLFHEKPQAGLHILDGAGTTMYRARYPERVYRDFAEIPPVIVTTLLYIENRELLGQGSAPWHNPAVEWNRLAVALAARAAKLVYSDEQSPGGSTLATQIEKYRYSPGGMTPGMPDKLRQMIAASLRAYRDGPRTHAARERIVRDYLNSTPLAGQAGFGEVHGLGDGLWAWYGMDFETVNNLLLDTDGDAMTDRGLVYRAALSLMLAQRRPAYYLGQGRDALARLTESYLHLLADGGVISQRLRDAALLSSPSFHHYKPSNSPKTFVERKAVNNLRAELLRTLGVDSMYNLDRFDLTVRTSVSQQVQEKVNAIFQKIPDKEGAESLGLIGHNLLAEDHLDKVRYSILLYESTPRGNLLRLQTDNLDQPLDLNNGSMLDLGSTAKLRTLISYLEIVETLFRRYQKMPAERLEEEDSTATDPINRWVLGFVRENPDATLQEMLGAAMDRSYSASPYERFFTAGGLHRFGNFDAKDNDRIMSVSEAFTRSVNLVFVRLMRDLVRYHVEELGRQPLFDGSDDAGREAYLRRFADREGRLFLSRFYRVYHDLDSTDHLTTLARRTPQVDRRLAMAFRAVRPHADQSALQQFLVSRLDDKAPSTDQLAALYSEYDPARFDSADRAYLADIHPLELWLVKYLDQNPGAELVDVIASSTDERQSAYEWLFRTKRSNAQNQRIGIELERDAFLAIHQQWQRLGYPFDSLVPSYATALGASADRPSALAELMGIIVNNGIRLPLRQIDRLQLAEGTPYETIFAAMVPEGERVLSPEVSATVYDALVGVVETGTGQRLDGVFQDAGGKPLVIGGKTGTGDHKSKQFSADGRLVDVKVENRNAIFTFFIDERFFGTVMAHVNGSDAVHFNFTSALAAQLFKSLEPALRPMIQELPMHLALHERESHGN